MRYLFLTAALICAMAGAAQATIADRVTDYEFSVPGVVQNASTVTVFQCTNMTDVPANMTVEVFGANGASSGSASVPLSPGGTGVVTTGAIGSLTVQGQMAIPTQPLQGAARILGSHLICAAYLTSPFASPTYMNALPVLAKTKQHGA